MRLREPALTALFAKIRGCYAWANTPSRRIILFDAVPKEQRPAFFQFEGGKEPYKWTQGANPIRTLNVKLCIYLSPPDETTPLAPTLSVIKDAIDGALAPDALSGKQTLGGTCELCRIDGEITNDPGDVDNDGLLIVPVTIVLP